MESKQLEDEQEEELEDEPKKGPGGKKSGKSDRKKSDKIPVNYVITGHGSIVSKKIQLTIKDCTLLFYADLDEDLACKSLPRSKNICNDIDYLGINSVVKDGFYNEMTFTQDKDTKMNLGIRQCTDRKYSDDQLPGEVVLTYDDKIPSITLSNAIDRIQKHRTSKGLSRTPIKIHVLACRTIEDSDKMIKSKIKLDEIFSLAAQLSSIPSKEQLDGIYNKCRAYLITPDNFKIYWDSITNKSPLPTLEEYTHLKTENKNDPRYVLDEERYARFLTEIQESSDKRIRLEIRPKQAKIINENYEKSKLQHIVECNLNTLVDPLVEPSSVKLLAEPSFVKLSAEPSFVKLSAEPSLEPSLEPSVEPSVKPSVEQSVKPSVEPSAKPSVEPSVEPSVKPSAKPMVPGPSILPDSDSKLKYLKYKTKYINLKMRTILNK
jgi:hypothetical protein